MTGDVRESLVCRAGSCIPSRKLENNFNTKHFSMSWSVSFRWSGFVFCFLISDMLLVKMAFLGRQSFCYNYVEYLFTNNNNNERDNVTHNLFTQGVWLHTITSGPIRMLHKYVLIDYFLVHWILQNTFRLPQTVPSCLLLMVKLYKMQDWLHTSCFCCCCS